MIKLHNIKNKLPEPSTQVFVKLKEDLDDNSQLPFYVCNFGIAKQTGEMFFREAGGEEYASFGLDEVEGWIEIDKLKKYIEVEK